MNTSRDHKEAEGYAQSKTQKQHITGHNQRQELSNIVRI